MAVDIQWVTTAANPRSNATGFDAGQRGWRLHAIRADAVQQFSAVRWYVALCGLRPRHGWSLDMFIDTKCSRCMRAIAKAGTR